MGAKLNVRLREHNQLPLSTLVGRTCGQADWVLTLVERLSNGASYRIARLGDGGGAEDLPPTPVQPDTLFVLGDNRDTSLESRHAEFGPVRAADLVGIDGTFIWSRVSGRMLAAVQ